MHNKTMENLQKTDRNFWMGMAEKAAEKSGCIRAGSHIGSVAVVGGRVVASGHNGVVGAIRTCAERGYCIRQRLNIPSGTQREVAFCICAEQRMICDAAQYGVKLDGAEVYVTHMPCAVCVRLLIESGISRVFYKHDYNNQFSEELAREAGFELIKL